MTGGRGLSSSFATFLLCAVYPSPDPGAAERCAPGRQVRRPTQQRRERGFHGQVPSRVRRHGPTVNGRIVASELGGNVEAVTINGSIRLQAQGATPGPRR